MVKRTKSNQIGEKAVLLVEKIFNEANWVCNRLYRDFGIDLHVKVFESEHVTPWELHVQVKGTEHPRISKDYVHYSIDTKHLKDWYNSPLPVLFVICDVRNETVYWLWIKEYLEELDEKYSNESENLRDELAELEFIEEFIEMKDRYSDELEQRIAVIKRKLRKLDWSEKSRITLRIPITNQLTPDALPDLFDDLKRKTLMRNALKVIGFVETPDEISKESFCFNSQYYRPLPELDQSIEKPALARCILCGNYFWIEEDIAIAWEFLKIYEPYPHEPAAYDCDVPEEFCPVCTSGEGVLKQCKNCGRYTIVPCEEIYEDWDDPFVSQDEARQRCTECLEELRRLREQESKGGNFI